MKVNKTISALALGLGVAVAAQAQTPVYITGSTAFRGQIFNALQNELGLTANTGDAGGNNSFTFHGSISDPKSILSSYSVVGTSVDVYCTFSGSAEGTQALISQQVNTYEAVGGGTTASPSGPDLAFSDVAQSVEPDADETALEDIILTQDTYGVAVQPFAFVANKAATTSGVNNMTSALFVQLYDTGLTGQLDLGLFNNTGSTSPMTAVGRYNLSGTRITAILDDGGYLPDGLNQWALATSASATPVGLASTDSGSPAGNTWVSLASNTNGYFTGGNVGKAIDNSSISGASAAVGYISFSDANGKCTSANGDALLNWNGTTAGTLPTTLGGSNGSYNIAGVENGYYQFWAYEQLYANPNDNDTFYDNNFGPALIAGLQYEITHSSPRTACLETEMNCYRNEDGGTVYHN